MTPAPTTSAADLNDMSCEGSGFRVQGVGFRVSVMGLRFLLPSQKHLWGSRDLVKGLLPLKMKAKEVRQTFIYATHTSIYINVYIQISGFSWGST